MISDFADEFWHSRARATDASIRWTDAEMLEVDVALVSSHLNDGGSLLDLGCGTGDLFLPLLDRVGRVTAVDMISDFLDRIPDDPKITKIESKVDDFAAPEPFDLAVMFGVVTHLTLEQEVLAYRVLRAAAPTGVVIVKNQCGRTSDVEVDRWSDAFSSRYVGRYPSIEHQKERLSAVFSSVTVMPYPEAMNHWEDSAHVAFVCR